MSNRVFPETPGDLQFMNGGWPKGSIRGGLTKRELFAAMAMQGLSSFVLPDGHPMKTMHPGEFEKTIAAHAVRYADALIKELDRVGNKN